MAPAVLVSLVWIAGNSITNHYMHRVYDSHSRALAENVATIRAGWAMQDALWRLEAVAIEAAAKDPAETSIEVHELQSAFLQHLDDAERSSFTDEERILVKAVREHFAVYRNHVESRLEPSEPDRLPTAQAAERRRRSGLPMPSPNLAAGSRISTSGSSPILPPGAHGSVP